MTDSIYGYSEELLVYCPGISTGLHFDYSFVPCFDLMGFLPQRVIHVVVETHCHQIYFDAMERKLKSHSLDLRNFSASSATTNGGDLRILHPSNELRACEER